MTRLYPKLKHIYAILRRVHQSVPVTALKRLAGDNGKIASGFICVVSRESR